MTPARSPRCIPARTAEICLGAGAEPERGVQLKGFSWEAQLRHSRRILLSTVSSDAHTWNLVFLQLMLEEHGYTVTNLGPCVPDEVLLAAAREEQPDAVIISTVNGHGHLDGARLVRALRRDRRTRHLPAMIGGKLGIQGTANDRYADQLLAAGFDAVFADSTDVDALPRLLARLAVGAGREAVPAGGTR